MYGNLGFWIYELGGLILVGLLLAWVCQRWWRGRLPALRTVASGGVRWTAAHWTVARATALVLALLALLGIVAFPFVFLGWIVLAVVAVILLFRYRSGERRSLVWTLMVAAERGIPLEVAARAFAEERRDRLGARTLDLAEYLEAGLPLAIALRRSHLTVPPAVSLAIELGQQTGQLGPALRQTLRESDDTDRLLQSAAERLFYLVGVVLFGLGIQTFLMLRIVPALEKICCDFGMHLPSVARGVVLGSWLFARNWFVGLPLFLVLVILAFRAFSYYSGYSGRYLPGLAPLGGRIDRSVVLRWLAVALRQQRSFAEMMRLLAGYVTRRGLRRRLERAARRIEQGENWTESLQHYGLIQRYEAAVFQSAERSGNLGWALDEMVQSSERRAIYRLQAVLNVAFPLALLVLGGCVLAVAAMVLVPLIHMIQVLA